MMIILGAPDQFSLLVLKDYIRSFNFKGNYILMAAVTCLPPTNLGITPIFALRVLFSNFLMFGESQMIERILDYFSQHYFESNQQSEIRTSSALFTFTYAIIMLNSDLYNPQNQNRMQLPDFINNCKKINDGQDFSEQFLQECFNDIQGKEIKTFECRDMSYEKNLNYGNTLDPIHYKLTPIN